MWNPLRTYYLLKYGLGAFTNGSAKRPTDHESLKQSDKIALKNEWVLSYDAFHMAGVDINNSNNSMS